MLSCLKSPFQSKCATEYRPERPSVAFGILGNWGREVGKRDSTQEHLPWVPHVLFRLGCDYPIALSTGSSARFISSKRTWVWSLFVSPSQFQRLALISFLRPPSKRERKLESKYWESPDSNLYPETTRQGCLSLKKLVKPRKAKPQKVTSSVFLVFFFFLIKFPKLWMLIWMLSELFMSLGKT